MGPEDVPCDDLSSFVEEQVILDVPKEPENSKSSHPMEQGSPERTDFQETRNITDPFNQPAEEEFQKEADPQKMHVVPNPANDYASLAPNYTNLTSAFEELVQSLERLKIHSLGNTSKPATNRKHEQKSRERSPSSLKRKSRTPSIYSRAGSRIGSRFGSRTGSGVLLGDSGILSGISSPAAERPLSPFPDFFKDMPKNQDLWAQSKEAEVFEDDCEGRELKRRSWVR
jgi:hypothetical protein